MFGLFWKIGRICWTIHIQLEYILFSKTLKYILGSKESRNKRWGNSILNLVFLRWEHSSSESCVYSGTLRWPPFFISMNILGVTCLFQLLLICMDHQNSSSWSVVKAINLMTTSWVWLLFHDQQTTTWKNLLLDGANEGLTTGIKIVFG